MSTAILDEFGLTEKQNFILRFVVKYAVNNQRMPTTREMMKSLGITSPNGVTCHLKALIKKGFIVKDPFSARGLRIKGLRLEMAFQNSDDGTRLAKLLGMNEKEVVAT